MVRCPETFSDLYADAAIDLTRTGRRESIHVWRASPSAHSNRNISIGYSWSFLHLVQNSHAEAARGRRTIYSLHLPAVHLPAHIKAWSIGRPITHGRWQRSSSIFSRPICYVPQVRQFAAAIQIRTLRQPQVFIRKSSTVQNLETLLYL